MTSRMLPPDVYSVAEVARVAGVSPLEARALVEQGRIPTIDGRFLAPADAVRAVHALRGQQCGP